MKLARRAAHGNQRAFEDLCARKLQSILFTAYGILHNHHDAQDVAQEVVVSMFQNILANITGTNIGTVGSNLTKAKAMMRKSIEKHEQELLRRQDIRRNLTLSSAIKRALREEADEKMPPQKVEAVKKRCLAAIATMRFPAAHAALVSKAIVGGVTVATLAVGSLGVYVYAEGMRLGDEPSFETRHHLIQTVVPLERDPFPVPEVVAGEIEFFSATGELVQDDPVYAHLIELDVVVRDSHWQIRDLNSDELLYEGDGLIVDSAFEQMREAGYRGDFELQFTIQDEYTNTIKKHRSFTMS
jgi:hypothetical protein